MEDLLILILQGLAEFIFETFAYLPWDLFWYHEDPKDNEPFPGCFFVVLTVGAGALVGGASIILLPSVLIKWAWLRIALLFISPLISGSVGYFMSLRRQKRGVIDNPWFHFWISFCFSFGLVATRFAFAHRPA